MKRYISIARQAAKEKIGNKDDSVNSDEVELEREHFLTLKEGYTKVFNNAKSLYTDHWPSFLDHNDALSNFMLAFGSSLKESSLSSTSSTIVAESLSCVGNGLHQETNIAEYCLQSGKSGFLETTHKIWDVYIKDVNELRSKQELARLQLSHTLGQLKNAQKKASALSGASNKESASVASKLQQAEEANKLAQEEYDNATSSFIEGMGRLETSGRNEFVSSLTSLAEAHLRSMEDGVAMWKDVLANLARIDGNDGTIKNATPPPTPNPPPKMHQASIPINALPNSTTPTLLPLSTLSVPNTFSSSPSSPYIPPVSLDINTSSTYEPFDPVIPSSDAFPFNPTSDMQLRRSSSPKPLLPDVPVAPTSVTTTSEIDSLVDATTSTNHTPTATPHPDNPIQGTQEEYEELAL